jgi:putative peptidoglycan lipid II flippase
MDPNLAEEEAVGAAASGRADMRRSYVLVVAQSAGQLLSGFLLTLECAHFFGATRQKDAFDVAYLFTDALLCVAGFSLMQNVATAAFARLRARGDDDADRVFSTLVNLLFCTGAGLALLGGLLARPFIHFVAPGLGPEGTDLAVTQLLILLPLTLLIGMSMFLGAVQTAYGFAGSNELGWLVLRVFVIVALLLVPRSLGVTGLSLCYVVGGAVALVVQIRLLRRVGIRYRLTLALTPYVRTVLRQAVGFGVSTILTQAALLQMRNLASRGPAGTIATLGYALSVSGLVYQFVAKPVMLIEGPRIILRRETGRHAAARRLQTRVVLVSLALAVPLALGIILWRMPLVRILFERGAFDAHATAQTAAFLGVLALAAIGDTLVAVTVLPAMARSEGLRVPIAYASSYVIQMVFTALAFPWLGVGAVTWGVVVSAAARGVLIPLSGRSP